MTGSSRGRPLVRASSWLLFALLALAAAAALQGLGSVFPGDHWIAQVVRCVGNLAVMALLIYGSIRLLKRDSIPTHRLGLSFSGAHVRAFLLGCLGACVLMAALIAAMYAWHPFRWQAGSRSAGSVMLAGLSYLSGNAIEELLFRGYALIALARTFGTTRALWLLAVPFGLFHAPGLDAAALLRMMLTTGTGHFIFAFAYLGTRSLWAAISLHALANLLLHAVSGFGQGASAYEVVFEQTPTTQEAFGVFFATTAGLALLLSRVPAVRRGSAWLEDRPVRGASLRA